MLGNFNYQVPSLPRREVPHISRRATNPVYSCDNLRPFKYGLRHNRTKSPEEIVHYMFMEKDSN